MNLKHISFFLIVGTAGSLTGCSSPKEPAAPPVAATTPPTAAPKEPIDELFDAATACVENGKVNRGCDGYAKLSAFVNQQRREPALVGKLVTQAEGKDAARRALSLTLLARPFPEEGDTAARLLGLLKTESDPNVKADLLEALTPRSAPGVAEVALELLTAAPEPALRAAAARLLGSKAHERLAESAKPALLKALREDQAPAVRRQAATSLGGLTYAEALPDLVKALDDQLVAPSATFALARFKDNPAAFDAIWTRVEAGTKDGRVSLPLLASLRLLEDHSKFDKKKARKTLEKLLKPMKKLADSGDQTAQTAIKLVERNIDRLDGKTTTDSVPVPMGAKPAPTSAAQ